MRFFGNLKLTLGLFIICLFITSAVDTYNNLESPINSLIDIEVSPNVEKVEHFIVPIKPTRNKLGFIKVTYNSGYSTGLYIVPNSYTNRNGNILKGKFKVTLNKHFDYYSTNMGYFRL